MICWQPDGHDECCAFIGTTAAIISAIGAGVAAGGSAYAANKSAGAATDAAKMSTDAANHAADDQLQASREGIAFQEQQADYAAKQAEVNRRANYDQWAAHNRRLGSIGQMLGLGGTETPDYVPGVVPNFGTPGAPAPGGGTPPPGGPAPPDTRSVGAGQTPAAMYRARVPSFGAAVNPPAQPPLAMPASVLPGMQTQAPPWMQSIDPRTGRPLFQSFGGYLGAGA